MPAFQWYKVRLCHIKTQESANRYESCLLKVMESLMADSSTATLPILNLIAGGSWSRRQLHNGIWYVSVASKLRNPPTHLRVVFGLK